MKIHLETHDKNWKTTFENIKSELFVTMGFASPQIEHIGSTAVEGISAKPIIDILVGLMDDSILDEITEPMLARGFQYYEVFNQQMPYRRFFIKHKDESNILGWQPVIKEEKDIPGSTIEHNHRLAHIHVLKYKSEHWIRHIAFRDFLRANTDVRLQYQTLKENLSVKEWLDGNDYNRGKDSFIKEVERAAVEWYYNQ